MYKHKILYYIYYIIEKLKFKNMFGFIAYSLLDISVNVIVWTSVNTYYCGAVLYNYVKDTYVYPIEEQNKLEYKLEYKSDDENNSIPMIDIIDIIDLDKTETVPPSYDNTLNSITIEQIADIKIQLEQQSIVLHELKHTINQQKKNLIEFNWF